MRDIENIRLQSKIINPYLPYTFWSSIVFIEVTLGTSLILGALPQGENFTNSELWSGKVGFSDTPDKIVFLFWILTLVVGWLFALRITYKGNHIINEEESLFRNGTVMLAIIGIYVCMAFPDRVLGFWQGIPAAILIAVQSLTIAVVVLIERGAPLRWFINLTAATVSVGYLVSAGFQSANHIRDAYHSTIVLNDVLAQSAGQIPLGNAMANYTSLLGWPLKGLLGLFQANPINAGIWFLLVLQLTTVVIAVAIAFNRHSASRWGLIVLVAISWITLDPNQSGQTMLQSIAIAPARLLLPFITILILLIFQLSIKSKSYLRIVLVSLGALSFLSAVNNIEFGLTIWVTVVLFMVFIPKNELGIGSKALFFCLGNILALLGLALLLLINGTVLHLEWLITIPLLYASAGFDLLPMPIFGVHLYVVAVFIASSIVGLILARRSAAGSPEMHLGLILGIVGTWSALSLTYFTGRSVSAALISGYGLQLGVVSAALIGYVTLKFKDLGFNRESFAKVASAVVVTLPAAISISLYFIGTDPRATLAYGLAANPIQQEYGFSFPQVESVEELNFDDALKAHAVGQTVYPAHIRALATGVRSVARSPEQLSVSRAMGQFECESGHEFSYWIVPEGLDEKLLTIEECADRWSPTGIVGKTQDGKVVAVLQRYPTKSE